MLELKTKDLPFVSPPSIKNEMYQAYIEYKRDKKTHTASLLMFLVLEVVVGIIMIGTALSLG